MFRMLLITATLVLSTQFSSAQANKTTKTTTPAKTTTSSKTKEQQLKDLKTRKMTMPDGTVVDEKDVLIGTVSQEGKKDEDIVIPIDDEKPDTVFAAFKGGREAWTTFLIKNINADTVTKSGAPDGRYSVMVQFKVNKDGTLSDFEAQTTFGYHAEDEALRVMKLSPKWIAATVNGKQIVSYIKQPITFVVEK